MPPREWKLRVRDILEAITSIQEYVKGMDLEAFVKDPKTIDAVEFRFTVIGEAARHVPEEVVKARPEIPWRDMRDMRNVVVHAYFGIKTDVLWKTIQNDLSPLAPMLAKLLEEEQSP